MGTKCYGNYKKAGDNYNPAIKDFVVPFHLHITITQIRFEPEENYGLNIVLTFTENR